MRVLTKIVAAVACGVAGAAVGVDPVTAGTAGAGWGDKAVDLAGDLLTAVSGNLAHEAWNEGEAGLFAAAFTSGEIDRNHHVVLALRAAHHAALAAVLARFDTAWDGDRDLHRRAEAERFSGELHRFLKAACRQDAETGLSATERDVLLRLPGAFDGALAGRTGAAPADHATNRATLIEAALREIVDAAGTTAAEIPPTFVTAFNGGADGRNGWFDLFVRAAADGLKTNDAFRAIWTAEHMAALRTRVEDIRAGQQRLDRAIGQVLLGQESAEDAAERRHREQMAALLALTDEQRRANALAAARIGITPEALAPIMMRIGKSDVPVDQWPTVLVETFERLQTQGARTAEIHNDGAVIDRAIAEARGALAALDVTGALARLDRALAEDDGYEAALAAEAEARRHRKAMGVARAASISRKWTFSARSTTTPAPSPRWSRG